MLTEADAAEICSLYGLHTGSSEPVLTGPVARGQLGQVWRLQADGAAFAVKEWFATPDHHEVERDAVFAESARTAGLFTPQIVRGDSGRVIARVRAAGGDASVNGGGGVPVRVWDWVDLLPRTRRLEPEMVGRALALLHSAGEPTTVAVGNWFSVGIGESAWRALHERLVEAGAPFAGRLGALIPDLVTVESLIEPHERLFTCHRDLWSDNVLGTHDGRICIIDFENLGPADPSHELAMALFEFGLDDPSRSRRLHVAYVEAGGPGRVTRRGHFSMTIAMQSHIASHACAKWLGESDPTERARLASWFGELPEDPLTVARIDRILAAVT